jgi:GAF domain-containing protein
LLSLILLISPNSTLADEVTRVLPVSVSLIRLATITEVQTYLNAVTDDDQAPNVILVDAETTQQVVADCRQFCRSAWLDEVAIIALIVRAGDREAVIEAGADDYVLLPLLPAEIQARLAYYVHSAARGLNIWIEAFYKMNKGVSATKVLYQSLERLARKFSAPSAWVLTLEPDEELNLLSRYNLPSFLDQDSIFNAEIKHCLEFHREKANGGPKIIASEPLAQADKADTNGLAYYLSIPLRSQRRLIGLLNLIYPAPPKMSRAEKRALTRLGQDMGMLLEVFYLQKEAQIYATQNAFMVLIARTINERLDLNTILSLALEQAVPLLNASGGDIWLPSSDGQGLEMASSLSMTSNRQLTRRARGQGLVGWVAEQGQALRINHDLAGDTRFDPQVDLIKGKASYSLLAVPLHHREHTIGVLTVYNKGGIPFSNPDRVLLESIAGLTASAIANARLVQELRDYADQQHALYEMSQQIAAGLDLQSTLNRVLQWIGRLSEVEIGLLWLKENTTEPESDSVDVLHLVAALGLTVPDERQVYVTLDQDLTGWVVRRGKAAMVNEPARDPRVDLSMADLLEVRLRNIISVPMIYHDQIIGAISLLNKKGRPFAEADLTLLTTAVEMVAVAVGNARLHTQTVALMKERERLHKQVLQAERLATVGRLTASLSHEINNPMQTIRAALVLAKEELDNPRELDTYLDMSLAESERVVQLVKRMRQIYRPQSDKMESFDVARLLHDAISMAGKALNRQRVSLETDFAPDLPRLTGIANQLHLVFLNLILNLSDAISAAKGGNLRLRTQALPQAVRVEFMTDVPVAAVASWVRIFETKPAHTQDRLELDNGGAGFDLSLSHDIVVAHGGTISLNQHHGQTICCIELPLTPSEVSIEQ